MHYHQSASHLQLWISTLSTSCSFEEETGQCDCSGGACPESVTLSDIRGQIETLLYCLPDDATQKISLNPELFVTHIGDYTVAMSATGGQIVVLDAQVAQLVPFLQMSVALGDLKQRFSHWGDGKLEQIVAILLAAGILSGPGEEKTQSGITRKAKCLTAWLHLTHQCNLACQYCFVTRSGQRMNPLTAKRSVEAIYRSAVTHGYEQVRLKYAGGEPTLNFNALQAAQRQAEHLSAQTGIRLRTVLLTNGTRLTGDLIDFLLKHNIQVLISLDGISVYQDKQRPLVNGRGGSFDRIVNNLDCLIDQGIASHISITITEQSLEGLPDLVSFLLDRQLHFSFNFYREPDELPTVKPLSFITEELIAGLFQAFRAIEQMLPSYSLLSNLADRADAGNLHSYPCGVGRNYLVIDSDGTISKCQMDIGYPVASIEACDPLALVQADTKGIKNLAVDEKECRECVWRYRCAGGCPRLTFQRTGRYDAQSPLCEVYQTVLPKVVRLEASRMIRYEKPWDFDTFRTISR